MERLGEIQNEFELKTLLNVPNVDCSQWRQRKSVEYTERDDTREIRRLTNAVGHLVFFDCFGVKKNKGEKKAQRNQLKDFGGRYLKSIEKRRGKKYMHGTEQNA